MLDFDEFIKLDTPNSQRQALIELEFNKLKVLNEILRVLKGNNGSGKADNSVDSTSSTIHRTIQGKRPLEKTSISKGSK